jgi:putative ABC transport system ATP-binding protein
LSQKKVIEVKNLKKTFGKGQSKNQVLKGVNFKIYSGEFVVIFGPSGCGKTTLLNCMIGLEPPTEGEIDVRGTEIASLKEDERADFRARKFGIVYQMPYWVKSLNVKENVALPLTIAGSTEENALKRAKKTLSSVGLDKQIEQTPTELSGGEQQRAGLARALVSWPWIIVADEPTGNLDVESGKRIMDLLKKLSSEQKRTVILVTHNIDYLQYATRTIAMEDGQIVGDSKRGGTQDIISELEQKINILRKEKEAFNKDNNEK